MRHPHLALSLSLLLVSDLSLAQPDDIDRSSIDASFALRNRPVETIEDLLSTEASIVVQDGQVHVRGGSGLHTKFLLNGMPLTEPLTGEHFLAVSLGSLTEVTVLSGAFDAEYGSAIAGIVELSTKSGGPDISGFAKYATDRILIPDGSSANSDRLLAGIGGRLGRSDFRWYLGGETAFTDADYALDRTRPSKKVLGLTFEDRASNRYQYHAKVDWVIDDRHDRILSFENLYSRDEFQGYHHAFSRTGYWSPQRNEWSDTQRDSTFTFYRAPDHAPDETRRNRLHMLAWAHHLSPLMVYRVCASVLHTRGILAVADKAPAQYDYFYRFDSIDPGTDYFIVDGDYPRWRSWTTEQWTGRADLTRGFGRHRIKTGLTAVYYDVAMDDALYPSPEEPNGFFSDRYHVYACAGSGYIEDRIRVRGAVVSVGMRGDVFDPGKRAARIASSTRAAYFEEPQGTSFLDRVQADLSPRAGIALPFFRGSVLHAHYGHVVQMPPLGLLYTFIDEPIDRTLGTVGNPLLEPERAIGYQVGVSQPFSREITLGVTAFQRRIEDLIVVRPNVASGPAGASGFFEYANDGEARVKGVEIQLQRARTGRLGGALAYTVSRAGTRTDLTQFPDAPVFELPADWDRTHTVNASLVVASPGDWDVSAEWSFYSGAPYTPKRLGQRRVDPNEINSRRLPAINRLHARVTKALRIFGREARLFAEGRNLLDRDNIRRLAPASWPANDALYDVYYTEEGELGGAYDLASVSPEATSELIPLGDPSVFEGDRNLRLGVLTEW